MIRVLTWVIPTLALALAGCGSESTNTTSTGASSGSTNSTNKVNNYAQGQNLEFDGEVSNQFPAEFQSAKNVGFEHYLELTITDNQSARSSINASQNSKIRIIATDDNANGEKILRAANILGHLLTNNTGSKYGADKSSIATTLASREATLMLTKNEDENSALLLGLFADNAIKLGVLRDLVDNANLQDPASIDTSELIAFRDDFLNLEEEDQEKIIEAFFTQLPNVAGFPKWILNSQGLYYRELAVVGDCHYMTNFDIPNSCVSLGTNSDGHEADRDAAFEEILHLVQAQGIAPNDSTKPYQELVRAEALRQYTDMTNGGSVAWNPTQSSWQDWENDDVNPEIGQSYSHEYLASVFEAYMGMWQHQNTGLDGYKLTSRDKMVTGDNGINDDSGLDFITGMFHDMMQTTVRIDSNGVADYHTQQGNLESRFVMNAYQVAPPVDAYTFKSQYYLNAKIIGDKPMSLIANNEDNILEGNNQPNLINGLDGTDTYIINNEKSECTITASPLFVVVSCPNTNDDILHNMEKIKFTDQEVLISSL
ncbi:hypothetical protein EK599_02680 [Vibrio sp. T187]|uniref:hypothetical protein n=1 Tax=Vibrio TaxID=662 RepID=UPI0010C9A74B|nr:MULTISPECIES: hypothetical protein [Vibrio]MBW3694580.1 hypothetical protein [Vibrio sp. T187]